MSNFTIEIDENNFYGIDPKWNVKWLTHQSVRVLAGVVRGHLPDFEKRIRKYLKAVYKWGDCQLGSEFDWGIFVYIAFEEDLEADLVKAGERFLELNFLNKDIKKLEYKKFAKVIAEEIALGLTMKHAGEIDAPGFPNTDAGQHWVDWAEFDKPTIFNKPTDAVPDCTLDSPLDVPFKERVPSNRYTYVLTLRGVHCLPVLHVWRNLSEEEYDRRVSELHMPFVDLHLKLAEDSLADVHVL